MIRDVILGLEYTHSLDIIHRDIKPSNLLLDHENAVKISDFGISHRSSSQDTKSDINSGFGTPAFLSPELCNCPEQDELQNFITDKVDIWAFGVSIYCLVFGELPFLGHNEYDLFNKIINDEVCYSLDRFVFLDEVSESEKLLLMDLLKKMLDKDPSQRIGLDNIKKHEFVVNDLKDDEVLKFQKFNEQFDITKNTDKLKKTNSIQRKFKSFFKRRSSSSASATNQPNLSSSTLSPSDTKLDSVIIESEGSDDDSIPIPPHLTRKLTELSVSGTFHTPAKSTNTLDISRPRLDKEKSSFTILPEDAILPTTRLHTPKRASSNSSSLPNSSNSMNLNSILKTKKSSKDDFNGFSIYQSYDDSDDDDDDDDDNDDDEDSDNDSLNSFEDFKDGTDVLAGHHDTYELIVDHETSVDIREVSVDGAKAKVTDISKVKTVNEYLDI
jgi:serine/threonine protein kinase